MTILNLRRKYEIARNLIMNLSLYELRKYPGDIK